MPEKRVDGVRWQPIGPARPDRSDDLAEGSPDVVGVEFGAVSGVEDEGIGHVVLSA
jgi:hypothetical protein